MAGTRAAIRYAKAVIGLAQENKATDAVNEDMKGIVATFAQSEELLSFLQNPVVKTEVKKASLNEIFPKISNTSKGLIDILLENKRIDILGEVAEKYIFLYDQLQGEQIAIVTTALPLDASLEKKIQAKIKELTGKEASIENKIDESIIGGFILRIGDLQYNVSIANKLNNLKREFTS